MSLLEDARRLAADMPYSEDASGCYYCGRGVGGVSHASDCPWLSLPKIVAVLESAEALIAAGEDCGPVIEVSNREGDEWQALVAALKLEVPPSLTRATN